MPVHDPFRQDSIERAVHGLQILRMEESLWTGLLVYAAIAIGTCVLFWSEWSDILLPATLVGLGTCALRLYLFRGEGRVERAARWAIWPIAAFDAVLAVAMTVGYVWILFASSGATALFMATLTTSILWAGTIVHLSLFPIAATFILVQLALWVAVGSLSGWTADKLVITAVFALSCAVAGFYSRQLSRWLEGGLRQQLRFERQAAKLQRERETISLLLREQEDETSDWLWQCDLAGRLYEVSVRFADAFALQVAALEGKRLSQALVEPAAAGNSEALAVLGAALQSRSPFRNIVVPGAVAGESRWWSVSGRPVEVPGGIAYRGVMSDVTHEHLAKAQALHLAHYDPLTDLPNRSLLLQRLETRLHATSAAPVAVLFLDLDGFKSVNDRYGHAAGDALLVVVAERINAVIGNRDLVARLGGDEFVVKTSPSSTEALETLAKALVTALGRPFLVEEREIHIGASVGIAVSPEDGTLADDLLRNADAALYRAKQDGRGTYRFFSAALDHERKTRSNLLLDLRNALALEEFVLHYQPFVEADTGAVTGYEALIRWVHPIRGLMQPVDFIPLAEESHLVVPIGAWVIRAACAAAAGWDSELRVSVNVSPVQFLDRELPDRILAALVETSLAPHRLEIELTESIFVSDIERALAILRRIRALGVRVALDDFGTGYSSLSYLQSFPFDRIKIDRAFVRGLSTRRDSQVIIRAVGDIARGLGMTITAEGVETTEQADLLKKAGCQELQGFLFGRPGIVDRRQVAESPAIVSRNTVA